VQFMGGDACAIYPEQKGAVSASRSLLHMVQGLEISGRYSAVLTGFNPL